MEHAAVHDGCREKKQPSKHDEENSSYLSREFAEMRVEERGMAERAEGMGKEVEIKGWRGMQL